MKRSKLLVALLATMLSPLAMAVNQLPVCFKMTDNSGLARFYAVAEDTNSNPVKAIAKTNVVSVRVYEYHFTTYNTPTGLHLQALLPGTAYFNPDGSLLRVAGGTVTGADRDTGASMMTRIAKNAGGVWSVERSFKHTNTPSTYPLALVPCALPGI